MIKKASILAFVLILLATAACSQTQKPKLLTFADLQKYDLANETFSIEGYVLDIYKCPPCPPQAMCKPCIPDNITITDTDNWKDLSKLKRLRVYTEQTDKFASKGKYLLTVKVKGSLQAGQPVGSVELLSIDAGPSETTSTSLAGNWTGSSLCTIKTSPCHDEQVIYHITEPDTAGNLKIQADKVVNGQPEEMGTIDCTFDAKAKTLTCPAKYGLWEFKVTGNVMSGTLKQPDGTLYRNIAVKKEVQN